MTFSDAVREAMAMRLEIDAENYASAFPQMEGSYRIVREEAPDLSKEQMATELFRSMICVSMKASQAYAFLAIFITEYFSEIERNNRIAPAVGDDTDVRNHLSRSDDLGIQRKRE